jgi:hypothetical protein
MNGFVRRGALPVLVALMVGGLTAVPANAAPPTWVAPPVKVSLEGSRAFEPQVAVDAAGNVTAIWTRVHILEDLSTRYVAEAATHAVGGAWSSPLTLSGDAIANTTPQVAVDAAGNATAVWRFWELGHFAIIQSSYRPAGGSWSSPVDISASDVHSAVPRVAVDAAGNAVAIWSSLNKVTTASRPVGGAWTSPQFISEILDSNDEPLSLAMTPSGAVTAAWQRAGTTNLRVETAERPSGGVWSAPVFVSPDGIDATDPDLASSASGATALVWAGHLGVDDDKIQAAVRPAPGQAFGAVGDVSADGAPAQGPQVAIDADGDATAVWQRTDPGATPASDDDWDVIQTSDRAAGGTWSTPLFLTDTGEDSQLPDVAVNAGGSAVAVWNTNADPFVVRGASRPAGGSWAGSPDLTKPFFSGVAARVAVDPAGNAAVVWTGVDPGSGPIWVEALGLDAAPPILTGLSVPGAGTAGQALAYSVTAKDAWSTVSTVWSFGDGGHATGASTTHTYAAAGSYPVSVTATDALGNSATLSGTTAVVAAPPVPPKPAAPVLSGVKLTKKTIHVVKSEDSPRATKLKLTLNTDAIVTVKLKRTKKVDGKAVKAKLSRAVTKGAATIKLTSKVSGKKLPPGTYKVSVTAKNSVGTSAAVVLKLKILA